MADKDDDRFKVNLAPRDWEAVRQAIRACISRNGYDLHGLMNAEAAINRKLLRHYEREQALEILREARERRNDD